MKKRTRAFRSATAPAPTGKSATTALVVATAPRGAMATSSTLSAADEALVSRAVAALRSIVVAGTVRLVAQAGEYVIEHFYAGDVEAARSHQPVKVAALRRLAERAEEFGMKPSQVMRCVPFALQIRLLGAKLADQLRQDHHLVLLPLRDPEEKRVLAEAAVAAHWTAAELRHKVRELQAPHSGGRSKEPVLRVTIRRLERLVAGVDVRRLGAGREQIEPAEARQLRASLGRAAALVERMKRVLDEG